MEYILHILTISGIYMILTLSLNLVVGYTGLPALGHAAFSCIGAYTSALLTLKLRISPWLGILLGGIFSSFSGAIIGFSSIRLKKDYLALATLGAGVIVYIVVKNWVSLTRGPMGLPGIPGLSFLGYELTETWQYLIVVGASVLITVYVLSRLVNSPFGKVLQAIRDDEIAVIALARNTNRFKLLSFIVSSFFAGIAGGLYAHYITFIDPSSFTVMESMTILLMVILGGMGSIEGSLIGAFLLVLFPELLRFVGLPSSVAAPLRQMLYGLILVILVLKRPQGLFGKYRWS